MNIFFKINNSIVSYNIDKDKTVESLSKFIISRLGVKRNSFWFSNSGKILFDNQNISEILSEDSTINVNFRPYESCIIISRKNRFSVDLNMIISLSENKIKFDYLENYF